MSDIILEMQGITKRFSGIAALQDVSFKVKRNEIHVLVGENGAGKSTLINVLSGLYPCKTYEGRVLFQGKECLFHSIKDSEAEGIVIIHQELALIPELSIAENVFMGNPKISKHGVINWDYVRQEAAEMLRMVGLENENMDMPVKDLGVGKQQLIEISKALAKEATLLVLDEPTAALNDEESSMLLNLLLKLKEQNVTIILISHKLHEVTRVADAISILRDGKIIETLTHHGDISDENRIIKGMVGRDLTQRFPKREAKIGNVMFEVENWSVYSPINKGRKLIDNVNFYVRKGEVVGFAGLMGAGRTELAMSIYGKSYGSDIQGVIRKNGEVVVMNTVKKAIQSGVVYVTEDRKNYGLVMINDIKWNIALANLDRFSRNLVIDRALEDCSSQEAAAKTHIKASDGIHQVVSSLSGGNQQKVVLAKWITAAPDVLILDEPTRGIDVLAKFEIYSLINELAQEGKAIILISSDMPELLGMSDRIYVLSQGTIAGEFAGKDVSQEMIMKSIMEQGRRQAQ